MLHARNSLVTRVSLCSKLAQTNLELCCAAVAGMSHHIRLNEVYSSYFLQLVGLLLIGVAAWGKGLGVVSSIHIIGGVIAVGVFLLFIAVAGLVGAVNHHQVLLFFVS